MASFSRIMFSLHTLLTTPCPASGQDALLTISRLHIKRSNLLMDTTVSNQMQLGVVTRMAWTHFVRKTESTVVPALWLLQNAQKLVVSVIKG